MRALHRQRGSGRGLEALFGITGGPRVAMTSPTAPGVTHRWTNLRVYADEVSNARIWAGFHYRFSTVVGADMGRKLGDVARTVMQPAVMATR